MPTIAFKLWQYLQKIANIYWADYTVHTIHTVYPVFTLFSLLTLLPTRYTALDQKGYFANLAGLKCRLCFLTLKRFVREQNSKFFHKVSNPTHFEMHGVICVVLQCFMISQNDKGANICEMRIKFETRISPTHGGEMVKRKSNLARFQKFLPCSYFQLKVQIICRQGLCFRLQHDPLYLCLARTSALSE